MSSEEVVEVPAAVEAEPATEVQAADSEVKDAAKRRLSQLGQTASPKPGQRTSVTNLMAQMQNGFSLGVTWARQKIGTSDRTEESKEYKDRVAQLQRNKQELCELLRWATALHRANTEAGMASGRFSSSLAKLGSHRKATKDCSETVQMYVPMGLELDGIRAAYTDALHTLILKPLDSLVVGEVKNATNLLNKVDVSRLELDARLLRVRENASKQDNDLGKVAASAREEEARRVYEKSKDDFQTICEVVEAKKNALLTTHLGDFVKAQAQFFEASSLAVQSKIHGQLVVKEDEDDE